MRMFVRLQSKQQKSKFNIKGDNQEEDLFNQKEDADNFNTLEEKDNVKMMDFFVYIDENHENL